jgi:hypothetical protein
MNLIKENDIIIDSDTGEIFFDLNNLPKSIQLNQCTFINDCRKFVESHLSYIKTYEKTNIKTPFVNRLIELKNLL